MDGEEYYPESGEEAQAAPSQTPPTPEEMEPEGEEEEYSGNETTIPLSMFSENELTPGQTITLKVVRILDSEAVVAPVSEGKSSPMTESMASLETMAEES